MNSRMFDGMATSERQLTQVSTKSDKHSKSVASDVSVRAFVPHAPAFEGALRHAPLLLHLLSVKAPDGERYDNHEQATTPTPRWTMELTMVEKLQIINNEMVRLPP